jgi:hypothetical protein
MCVSLCLLCWWCWWDSSLQFNPPLCVYCLGGTTHYICIGIYIYEKWENVLLVQLYAVWLPVGVCYHHVIDVANSTEPYFRSALLDIQIHNSSDGSLFQSVLNMKFFWHERKYYRVLPNTLMTKLSLFFSTDGNGNAMYLKHF